MPHHSELAVLNANRNSIRKRGVSHLAHLRDMATTELERATLTCQIQELEQHIEKERLHGPSVIYDDDKQVAIRSEPLPQVDNTGGWRLSGYAAIYGELSSNVGGYRDRLQSGCFRDALDDDIVLNVNHHDDQILARSQSGTLRLFEDDTGLAFSADLPDTSLGRDIVAMVQRGDLRAMSYQGLTKDNTVTWTADGYSIRDVWRFTRLVDISIVTRPGFPATNGKIKVARIVPDVLPSIDNCNGHRVNVGVTTYFESAE